MAVEHVARLDALVQQQHGLVTTAQAVTALGPSRKQRWVAERRLVSVQPGVFRMAGAPETWHQSLMAAILAVDGAVVSHRSAAELWGLVDPVAFVDVSIRPPKQPRLRPPAIAHRILDLRPDLAVERERLPVTDAVRTIVDLGLVVSPSEVGDAMSRGISTRLFGIAELARLREALGRHGRNGTGVVGDLLEQRLLDARPEDSLLERRLAALARLHDLPAMETQYEVWHAGRFVARVDAAFPDRKVAIEVDGFAYHSSPEAFQRDRTRQNQLVSLGWTVLRFTWDDLVNRPTQVAKTILDAVTRISAA